MIGKNSFGILIGVFTFLFVVIGGVTLVFRGYKWCMALRL